MMNMVTLIRIDSLVDFGAFTCDLKIGSTYIQEQGGQDVSPKM